MGDIDEVVQTFSTWAADQGLDPARAELRVQRLGRPHTPAALPSGWQGVYGFRCEGAWLKVGKAGPKSGARWVSQHYNPRSAMSTLAFSLVKYGHYATMDHPSLPGLRRTLRDVSPGNIGEWIRRNTECVNFLLRTEMGASGLSRLESIAHARLKPVLEGVAVRRALDLTTVSPVPETRAIVRRDVIFLPRRQASTPVLRVPAIVHISLLVAVRGGREGRT